MDNLEFNDNGTDSSDVLRLLCELCDICQNETASYDYSDSSYLSSYYYEPDDLLERCTQTRTYIDNSVGPTLFGLTSFVFSVTVFLSITGNSLAICILAFGNRVRTNFNSYLINLAVSDLQSAIFCMPFTTVALLLGRWPFGVAMCPFVVYMQQVSVTVSVYTLTAIAIDRYFAVVHPLKAKISLMRPAVVNAIVWVVSMLLGTVQLIKARTRAYPMESGEVHYLCDEVWTSRKNQIVYELFIIIFTYIGPLAVISYSYYAMVKILWMRQLPGNPDKLRDHRHAKSKRKVAKMAVTVVILFALCWLPLHTLMFVTTCTDRLTSNQDTFKVVRIIYFFFYWLAMANSFINPFIYTIYHEGFRTDLRELGTLCRRSGRRCLSKVHSPLLREGALIVRSKSPRSMTMGTTTTTGSS